MSEYTESENYDYLVSPVTYVSLTQKSDGTEFLFDDKVHPVKLVLYVNVNDASKQYRVMTYDLDTDAFTIDESISISA
jgi:hypothetical protein